MLKEIHEQPTAIRDTVMGRVSLAEGRVYLDDLRIPLAELKALSSIRIAACGTSWHAGLIGKHLIESLARVPVDVDYASECRYRSLIVRPDSLTIGISQSGETADTLAALREVQRLGGRTLAVCNATGSMMTRDADSFIQTLAGPEIGVASTKAFTTQIAALYLFALYLAQVRATCSPEQVHGHLQSLLQLPALVEQAIGASAGIAALAERFHRCRHFLFLGRGINHPVALEGALKLKEISYIHAEGYPAGELKHGPIALIDEEMPVVALAPDDRLFDKMLGNVQEAKARGASIIALTTQGDPRLPRVLDPARDTVLPMPAASVETTPAIMTIPLQLLAYHIALRRGCDVDQPRNLAKSVTVE
jgi:glucosamine--fructose-6-phosphate aminotransferase (isomerizing)